MPNGMVANHSSAGSLALQYWGDPMYAWMSVPLDVASKHSNGGMIWPPGMTSIRKRPPLISSTTCPRRWALLWRMSCPLVQAVDIRHWIFGWAMTWGASTATAAPAAASAPPAFTMNRRRFTGVVSFSRRTSFGSPCHELVIRAFGDVIPGADQRLEFRERRVDLPRHGRLLRFLSDGLSRELLELVQDRRGELEDLDLGLELRLELLERNRILRVEAREAIHLHRGRGVVEHPPKLCWKRVVRLLVEAEVVRGARLVPTRVIVVPCGPVEA